MAKNAYIGVSNVARKIKQPFVGVGGVARKIKNAYIGVGGVARQFFQSGTPVSTLAVGSSVYMNVNGGSKEFLVVHQGNPNASLYDSSCNGTWLLMKDIYENRIWDGTNNDYANSDVHSYLNGTFLGLFDSSIQGVIKQAKIPYQNGTGNGGSIASGSNGLSAKIFLLGGREVGILSVNTSNASNSLLADGSQLSYFPNTTMYGDQSTQRIAYLNGTASIWWLRTPYHTNSVNVNYVRQNGAWGNTQYTNSYGIRPALILPGTAVINENKQVIG